jgi:hypothetical protein
MKLIHEASGKLEWTYEFIYADGRYILKKEDGTSDSAIRSVQLGKRYKIQIYELEEGEE